MVDFMLCCLANLLFFDSPLFNCYTNICSAIICCLFSGEKYLFFWGGGGFISVLASSFCEGDKDFFDTFVILSAILLPVK